MAMRFREHQEAAQTASRRLLYLFALVLVLLVLAVNGVLALIYRLSFPWTQSFPPLFFETNTALTLLFVLGGCWFETLRLREGGAHVARLAGGVPIDPPQGRVGDLYEKRLRNVVDEVALAVGMKPPPVYVLQGEQAINAFAAGWDADDAVIVVTRGALERLTRDELQGVVAHEFSHLFHGDTRLNMRLIGLVWGLQMIYTFGRTLVEPDAMGRRKAGVLVGLALMAVGALGWLAGRLLKAAVSRQREFLADASAVKYTRSIEGIGGALRKIADQAWRGSHRMAHPQVESLSHLLFVSRVRWDLFATHPPLAERIRRIYGFEVVPLAARVLPAEDDDAPLTQPMAGWVAAAEDLPADGAGAVGLTRPAEAAAAAAPTDARRHDAAPDPAGDGLAQHEREALARIERWQGPGERRAAVLGLLVTPGQAREWQAWAEETAGLAVAPTVRAELEQLKHRLRLPVWEMMLRRCAKAPLAERRGLVEAARRIMKADGHVSPMDRLRWLAMRHVLSGAAQRLPPPTGDNDIAHLAKDVTTVTAFLARIIDAQACEQGQAGAWYQRVMQGLWGPEAVPTWSAPDLDAWVQAWHRLMRLSAMQRPVLLKAWVDAAWQCAAPGQAPDPAACDALRLCALLLDTPSPKALADQYIDVH
ncbi:M48 family metallopeptidase [Caldimonas manganoxidans]|uniref:M48 family metallopeptidase n=1 Tax=Caldimonas manganoxidans TaxID=196015 RepID=UPI000382D0F4|nr:M48 family metallopeptidase [Caldimonas manganoxidans]